MYYFWSLAQIRFFKKWFIFSLKLNIKVPIAIVLFIGRTFIAIIVPAFFFYFSSLRKLLLSLLFFFKRTFRRTPTNIVVSGGRAGEPLSSSEDYTQEEKPLKRLGWFQNNLCEILVRKTYDNVDGHVMSSCVLYTENSSINVSTQRSLSSRVLYSFTPRIIPYGFRLFGKRQRWLCRRDRRTLSRHAFLLVRPVLRRRQHETLIQDRVFDHIL